MIGQKNDLINAANGIFAPRTIPAAESTDSQSAFLDAQRRRMQLAQSAAERVGSAISLGTPTGNVQQMLQGAAVPSGPMTDMYSKIVSGYKRPTAGLSAKGKYQGFLTSSDLKKAILGSASGLAEQAVSGLRQAASERFGQLSGPFWEAQGAAMRPVAAREKAAGNLGARKFEEISQLRTPTLTPYSTKLAEWYAANAAPAEQALKTATQFEATPVSDLATALASSAYGLNPSLARGMFAPTDTASKRNEEYKRQYGVSYDEIQEAQKRASEIGGPRAIASQSKLGLETALSIPAQQLQTYSGRTPEAMYSALQSPETFQIRKPDGQTYDMTPSAIVNDVVYYANQGDSGNAEKILKSLKDYTSSIPEENRPDTRVLEDLIYAILRSVTEKRAKARTAISGG